MRIGIKRDVSDREGIADEPFVPIEMAVHYLERDIAARVPRTQIVGSRSPPQQMEVKSRHPDVG
jgi:hypothetical protein